MSKCVTKRTIDIITSFRTTCRTNGFYEEMAVPIVSHHDKSIRFTNSTTSVLKPYLLQEKKINNGVFLIQPAIGLQGVDYWSNYQRFGRFSSSFYSCGLLCSEQSVSQCQLVIKQFLYSFFAPEELVFLGRKEDSSYWNYFDMLPIYMCKNQNVDDYRHRYGIDGYKGIDILILKKNVLGETEFGNISIIVRNGEVMGIEFSIDSTLLLSALLNEHAVFCLPGADVLEHLNDAIHLGERMIPMLDFCELTSLLFIDGLVPGSRGRRGNMKRIIREIKMLVVNNHYPPKMIYTLFEGILRSELQVLSNTTYNLPEKQFNPADMMKFLDEVPI